MKLGGKTWPKERLETKKLLPHEWRIVAIVEQIASGWPVCEGTTSAIAAKADLAIAIAALPFPGPTPLSNERDDTYLPR